MRAIAMVVLALICAPPGARAQEFTARPDLTRPMDYSFRHTSSADPTGANRDSLKVAPGETVTLFDADGPGAISHIWFTFGDREPFHLKRVVLRIWWDGEGTPSVEAPVGDFFGLGLGEYPFLAIRSAVGGQRQEHEQLFPDAVRAPRPHHHDQ